jgi:hypothetical protein
MRGSKVDTVEVHAVDLPMRDLAATGANEVQAGGPVHEVDVLDTWQVFELSHRQPSKFDLNLPHSLAARPQQQCQHARNRLVDRADARTRTGDPIITSNGEAGVIRRESAFRAGIAAQANIPDAGRRRSILDTRLDTPRGGCEEEAARCPGDRSHLPDTDCLGEIMLGALRPQLKNAYKFAPLARWLRALLSRARPCQLRLLPRTRRAGASLGSAGRKKLVSMRQLERRLDANASKVFEEAGD